MLKKILIIIPIILLLIVATFVVLHWQTEIISDLSKDLINNSLKDVGHFEYASLSGDLFKNLIIKDLTIILTNGVRVRSNYLKVRYSLGAALSGRYLFDTILFDSLFVYLPPTVSIDTTTVPKESDKTIEETLDEIASSIPLKTLLESLPELAVSDLKISYGEVMVADLDRTFENIALNMRARHRRESIELNIEKLSGTERNTGFRLDQLQVQIIGNKDRINLNRLEIQTPRSQIHAHAEVTIGDSLWVILGMEDNHISAADINSFTMDQFADTGFIDLTLDFVGRPNRFSAKLVGAGSLNAYQADKMVFDIDYYKGDINLQRALFMRDTSQVSFTGTISAGHNVFDMNFKHLDLSNFQTTFLPTDLSGTLYLETKVLKDIFRDGKGMIHIYHSSIDTITVDTLRIAVNAKDHNINFVKPSFLKLGTNSKFTFEGNLSKDNRLDLNLSTENNVLETLTSALNLPLMKGTFDGNFFLTGTLYDPDMEMYLWIPHIEKDTFVLDSMILQIDINNLASRRQGSGSILSPHWQYGDIEITETITNLVFDSNRVILDTLLFANDQNYISSTGYGEVRNDTIDLVFNFFRLNYQNSWIENEEELFFRLTSKEFIIENARFIGSNKGLIDIRGYWDRINDEMEYGLEVQGFSFDPFRQFMDDKWIIAGIVDADFVVANPLRDLDLEMEILGKNLLVNKVPLGNIHCDFHYAQNKLFIDEFKMTNGSSILEIDGDVAMELSTSEGKREVNILKESLADVRILWENLHLENYSPLLKLTRPIKGEVSGNLSLSGSIAAPRGKLVLDAKNVSYEKFVSNHLNLNVHFNHDSLVVDRVDLDLNDTDLSGTGWQRITLDLDNLDSVFTGHDFRLTVESKDDNVSFIGNFLDQVERIEGPYEAAFTFAGMINQPSLVEGYFRLNEGRLILSRIKNPITDIQIDATIENSRLVINSLSGQAEKKKDFWESAYGVVKRFFRLFRGQTRKEGELFGDGTIDLEDVTRPKLNLSLKAYQLYLDYFVENTNFVVSTEDLRVRGKDTISVEGDITVDQGSYIVDLDNLRKNIYLVSSKPAKDRPITWNLNLSMPGNFNISSSKLDLLNNFSLEIMGNLRSIQEANAPATDLTGHLEIMSGKYGSWGQNFTVGTGSIDFTDPKVINPDINIRAEKKAGDYYVELTLTGNLEEIKQEIQIKDENGNYLTNLTDEEILSLVSLGRIDFNVAGAGENVISTSVETAIERGAEVLTGLDNVEVASNDGGKILEFQSISLGKYLTSNLYVEYTGMFGSSYVPSPNLSWQSGNQIGIEYRINKNWSVDSRFMRTQRGNNIYKVALGWKTSF